MSKLKEIYDGWHNYIFPTPEIEALAKRRAAICAECEHLVLGVCSICGCPSAGKTRSPESSCPMGLWSKYSEEQKSVLVYSDTNAPDVPMDIFNNSDEYINHLLND